MSLADDRRSGDRLSDVALSELQTLLGERVTIAPGIRRQHADMGLTYHASIPPEGVAFPQSTEQVAEIVKICARHGVPVIAFGSGTSVEGQIQAPEGGIIVDLAGMNEVLRVSPEDLDCTVQAGTNTCATPGCFSRSTPAPTPRSAAWRRPVPAAPTPCATAPCERTCCR